MMTFPDALAATKGRGPITRQAAGGFWMLGHPNGSVEVVKEGLVVEIFPVGTGPIMHYRDWHPGGYGMLHGRLHDAKMAEDHE